MFEIRLGDVIDDYCIKCRRLTNHSIVSIVEGAAAKVRCRTCYNDHDYRNEQAPPTKKELKKLALFNEVLAGAPGAELVTDLSSDIAAEPPAEHIPASSESSASEAPVDTPVPDSATKKSKAKTTRAK